MKERRRNDFPEGIKKDVRRDQAGRCADCGAYCNGHPNSPIFSVHHVLPDSLGGSNERVNAIGLCSSCHKKHDELAICEDKLFYEVLMEEDRFTDVREFLRLAGISDRAVTARSSLRQALIKKDRGR